MEVTIVTGAQPLHEAPVLIFNGTEVPLETVEGGTGSGERFRGRASPRSVAHRVELRGPGEPGRWTIEQIQVRFTVEGRPPYEVLLGGLELDELSSVDIWRDPPAEVFEV